MKRSFYPLLCAVLFIAVSVSADERKPTGPVSPAAKSAIAKHDRAIAEAQRAYDVAKRAADQELVLELKAAQSTIMKNGGPSALAEAQAIQKVIDGVGAGSAPKTGDLREKLADTKWLWPDKQMGAKNWFTLNRDGTVSAGWHDKTGMWAVTPSGIVIARIVASDRFHKLDLDRNLTTATADDGKGDRVTLQRAK